MSKNNELGRWGEITAQEYLLQKGYFILETNWRFKKAEIDLIARIDNTVVFIEVKTRASNAFGNPEQSVDEIKRQNFYKASVAYQELKGISNEIRFDIVSILTNEKKELIEVIHFEDAFFPYHD